MLHNEDDGAHPQTRGIQFAHVCIQKSPDLGYYLIN